MLGGWWLGTTYFWPEDYVAVAQPYCTGVTPDGCVLRWQDVQTEEGDVVTQCVRLCPRAEATPPVPAPAVTELLPPPASQPPAAACLMEIFADPNFSGRSEETGENQQELGDWDRDIASIVVKSGTWDFYTEPDFKGDAMRLPPGRYATLTATFNNAIGSFLCLENRAEVQ